MRFRKLLLMIMHVLCNKMTATSAHRYCPSWKVTQTDEKRNRARSPLHARVKMLHIMCGKNYSTSARKMLQHIDQTRCKLGEKKLRKDEAHLQGNIRHTMLDNAETYMY